MSLYELIIYCCCCYCWLLLSPWGNFVNEFQQAYTQKQTMYINMKIKKSQSKQSTHTHFHWDPLSKLNKNMFILYGNDL